MGATSERQRTKDEGRRVRKGFFITFEGIEGSGKSTQMKLLAAHLRKKGCSVVTTREPGGTRIGNGIRRILLDPKFGEMDFRAEALLYAASRAQHVCEVIKPALDAGKVVISDRYVDSSLAYQVFGRGLLWEEIEKVNRWATGGLEPDLTILLYIPTEEGLSRAKESAADRIERESVEFHRRVQEGYKKLAQKFPERYSVVDATGSAESIHHKILQAVESRLPVL
ncbi:MAG TPA: dTMP kinase [Actinobacteria bacterium]|nr:dTMP kinase [Actinomycetota bacterium]